MPAAAAPSMSRSRSLPTITASDAPTSSASSAASKIAGSGLPIPMSHDATTTSKCSSMLRDVAAHDRRVRQRQRLVLGNQRLVEIEQNRLHASAPAGASQML